MNCLGGDYIGIGFEPNRDMGVPLKSPRDQFHMGNKTVTTEQGLKDLNRPPDALIEFITLVNKMAWMP